MRGAKELGGPHAMFVSPECVVGALAALAFGPDLEMPCRASCSAHGVHDLHGLKPANDINQHRAHDASKHHATQPPKRPEADPLPSRYAENGG